MPEKPAPLHNQLLHKLLKGVAQAFGFDGAIDQHGILHAKKITPAKPACHLVILLNPPCKSPMCANCGNGVRFHASTFSSLVAAETFRTVVERRTGGDARLISGRKLCERFDELFARWTSGGSVDELRDFIVTLHAEAKSPQLN